LADHNLPQASSVLQNDHSAGNGSLGPSGLTLANSPETKN